MARISRRWQVAGVMVGAFLFITATVVVRYRLPIEPVILLVGAVGLVHFWPTKSSAESKLATTTLLEKR